jgi:hypothetical protein
MTPTTAHNAYHELEAARAAAGKIVERAIRSGNLNALKCATEDLKRITTEFREALERELVGVPGKGRLMRAEHEALHQLARENRIDFSKVLCGIVKIEGGRVRDLVLSSLELTSVTALEKLTGLTRLDLSNNQLSDVAPLEKLTGLTRLDLSNNKLTDIAPLAKLTGLRVLSLFCNQLTNITPLANLTGLTVLHLSHNMLTDINPLATLWRGLKRILRVDNHHEHPANDAVLAAFEAKRCKVWR